MAKRAPTTKKEISKPKTTARGAGRTVERDDDDELEGEPAEFDPEQFKKHVANIGALKSKGAAIRGEIGAAVKNAEEDYGIHRGAASTIIKLHNMNEEARTAWFKAFDDMRTALGYATQADLFDPSPAAAATFAGRGAS